MEHVVKCASCGCTGNGDCGHEPPDTPMGCALDRAGVCPCCNAAGTHCDGCNKEQENTK